MEKKYLNFYAPAFEVIIDDKNILKEGVEITSVSVENSVEGADSFSFTINNAFDVVKKEFNWLDDYFSVGKRVEIKMGYADRLKSLIFGPITSVEVDFPAGGFPQVVIGGLDSSHLMMKGSACRSWDNVKDSEVVKKIAGQYKISNLEIEETPIKHPKLVQDRESDFSLLTRLAARNGFEFFVLGKTLYFRDPAKRKEEILTLEWGKNLLSFSPRVNVSAQVSGIEARSWDAGSKQVIVGKAGIGDETGSDGGLKSGGELARDVYGKEIVERLSCSVRSQEEAVLKAKTEYNQRVKKLLTGSGESIGIPDILAGGYIKLEGLGKKFSKTYYLTRTEHAVSGSGYQTTFSVEGKKL